MTTSELSKKIPLKKAIEVIDSIVANHPANRVDRDLLDLSMIRISEAANLSEKLSVEVNTTVDTWGTYTFNSSAGNIVTINAGNNSAGLAVIASGGSYALDIYNTTTRWRAYTTDFYISRGASELERISFVENFIRINAATGVGINTYNVQATLDITGIDASTGYSLRLRDNSSIDKFKFRNDGSLMMSNGGFESTIKQVYETDSYNSYLSISPANNTFKMYFSEVGFGHWNYGAGNPNLSPWDGASLLHKNRGFEVVTYGGSSTFIRVQASTDLQQLVFDNSNKMFLNTNFFHTKAITGGASFFQVDQTDAGNGQVKVGIGGISLGSVHSSAIFEIKSTDRGFLPPRMLGSAVEAIPTPAEWLIAYATDGSGTTVNSKGWWGYDGTTWVKLN